MSNSEDGQRRARQAYVEAGFIKAADHNYVLARIAFDRGLIQEGYWEASQAIEKYFKASILLAGLAAHQGHDFKKMIASHEPIWPGLLDVPIPDSSPMASPVHVSRGGLDTVRAFLARLGYFGSPQNRYGSEGYVFDYLEVNKLDFVALLVRSTCRAPQTIEIFTDWRLDDYLPIETWAANPASPLAKDFFEGNAVWSAAVQGQSVQVSRKQVAAYQASALQTALSSVGEKAPAAKTATFLEWVVANVHLVPKDRKNMQAYIETLRSKE